MKKTAIIVAAGIGNRMQSDLPKQFLLLAGKMVLMHSVQKFYDLGFEIIITLSEDYINIWKKACNDYLFKVPHQIVIGGKERFHSIQNAVAQIPPTDDEEAHFVAVHDAARPHVSEALIQKLLNHAAKYGNAIPGVKPTDTLRKVGAKNTLQREDFWCVQTPQIFDIKILKTAYQQKYQNYFTDDASVVEALGENIEVLEGEKYNIKITYAEDLKILEAIMSV